MTRDDASGRDLGSPEGFATPPDETIDPALLRLGARLAAGGVRWAVLRGAIDRPTEGDLDLVVHPADMAAFRGIARTVGFPRLPAWGHGHHRFHLGRGIGGWWRLDLVDAVRFAGGVRLEPSVVNEILARRSAGPVPRLHPDDAAAALTLHLLLDREERSAADRARLAGAAGAVQAAGAVHAAGEGPLAATLAGALPEGWSPGRLVAALRDDDPGVGAIRGHVRLALRRQFPEARGAAALRRLSDLAGARLRKPLTAIRRVGPSVALMGPDGAGKSALIGSLIDAFPLPVRTAYLGLYPVGGARTRGPKGLGFLQRIFTLWRRYLIARGHRWRGRLVVFDRHPLDARLPARGAMRRSDRLRRWILGHALPTPDLVLVLDAPGHVLHARKAEYPAEVLEVERQRYRELADRVGRAELVDATRSPDDVLHDAVERIWRVWATRLDPAPDPRQR
ncbi:MAG: hypothetical protein ABIQ58_07635 [Candidatus Limnocylindrales bacterium]